MPTPEAEFDRLLNKVAKGVPRVKAETAPDPKDIKEEEDYDTQRLKAIVRNEILMIGLRETYGKNIIRFLWVYFILTVAILTLHGFKFGGFELPEIVLAAVVGGTAVSVIGVVGTVAAGLFKPPAPPSA